MQKPPFHILIADDDADDQTLLADAINAISTEEIKISTIANGAELLNYLHKTGAHANNSEPLPNVILLDINMPYTNGLEALQIIKNNPGLRHILVYMVTTMRNVEKLEKCLDLGADNFFTKPNDTKGYSKIIREVLQNSGVSHRSAVVQPA